MAYPSDSRLLEVAREKIARLAARAGIKLKQTFQHEGKTPRRRASGYAYAKQFKRLRGVLKRQRTVLGVKVSLAVTHKQGLIVGARSFPGNPYDGHTLAQQLEQTNTLLQDIGVKPTTAIVDLGFRGVDEQIAPVLAIHRGRIKTLDKTQRKWFKRRQAIEPIIGNTKHDNRMDRCWLKGADGDAMHAVLCAAGFNIRWLLRAAARLGLAAFFVAQILVVWWRSVEAMAVKTEPVHPSPMH